MCYSIDPTTAARAAVSPFCSDPNCGAFTGERVFLVSGAVIVATEQPCSACIVLSKRLRLTSPLHILLAIR